MIVVYGIVVAEVNYYTAVAAEEVTGDAVCKGRDSKTCIGPREGIV